MTETVTPEAASDGTVNQQEKRRQFRPGRTAMPREAAARQLRLTSAAWAALRTPECVKAFLNSHHAELSARPIDVGIASDAGLKRVERLLAERPLNEREAA